MNCIRERNYETAKSSAVTTTKNKAIVILYFDKKQNIIINDFNERQRALIDNDENIIKLKALIESFKLDTAVDCSTTDYSIYLTKESREDADRLYKDYKKATEELSKIKIEVRTVLSGCTNYDEEIEVLRGYGIIVKNPEGGIKMNTPTSDSPFLSI